MVHVLVNSTANALCGSHAFQHNFQLFVAQRCIICRILLLLLESPERHFSTPCCNISMSLTDAEYAEVFRCFRSQKSRGLRSGDRAGQFIGPPRPSHCSPKAWLRSVWQYGENAVLSHRAWTTRVVVYKNAHVASLLVNHSPKTMINCTC
jgi:hypothetical protein